MLRKFWLLSILMFFSGTAFSQFYIGPKFGLNVYKSKFNFPEDEEFFDQKWKLGYQIGGAFDLPLENIFHFHPELYYSRKGKKTEIIGTGITNNATYNFIEAPIYLRMSFEGGQGEAGTFYYHIDIGPTISYWLGGKGTLDAGGPTFDYTIKFGETEDDAPDNAMYITDANRWQWGLSIGFGTTYPVVRHQFVNVDLRIGIGGTHLAGLDGEAHLPILGFVDSLDVSFLEISLSGSYVFEIDWAQTKKGKSTINRKK